MRQEAPLVLVDALQALLSAHGTTPALEEEALLRIHTLKQHPNEAFVLGVPTLIEALAHWYRVTGGDAVTDALAQWLDTMDPKTTAGLDRRLLREVQLLCPRLIPFASTPKEPADPRFTSYVEALFAALAERAGFASVDAWKSTVSSKLQEVTAQTGNLDITALPSVVHGVAESRTAFGEDNGARATEKRVSEAHFTPEAWAEMGAPQAFIDEFSVYQERTVVAEVRDGSLEVSVSDARLEGAGEIELGEVVSLVDDTLTRALRISLVHALGR
jgi:hypothetical protein